MMKIFIQPSDVLLFRDGRPFSAGEGHRARSLFPPTPNTMQGVVRSKVLADRCGRYYQYRDGCLECPDQEDCTIPEEIGRPAEDGKGNYGQLHLRGALIAQYSDTTLTPYFPIPGDVVQVKNKNKANSETKLVHLQPLQSPLPGVTNLDHSLHPLWTIETQPVEAVTGYWTQKELQNYLLGQQPGKFITSDKLFHKEARFGIEVNNRQQTVEEGKIYQTEFVRCQENVGLYVEVDGIEEFNSSDSSQGLIAIGGENRAASYYNLPGIDWDDFSQKLSTAIAGSTGFKLFFATPTIFQQGWLPNWINPKTLTGTYQGIEVQLISAAIGRYQTIGGWDVAYNRPKPTSRALTAGSVYYFTTSASPDEVIKTFHWQNLADNPKDAQIGFGLSLVGCWNYLQS